MDGFLDSEGRFVAPCQFCHAQATVPFRYFIQSCIKECFSLADAMEKSPGPYGYLSSTTGGDKVEEAVSK